MPRVRISNKFDEHSVTTLPESIRKALKHRYQILLTDTVLAKCRFGPRRARKFDETRGDDLFRVEEFITIDDEIRVSPGRIHVSSYKPRRPRKVRPRTPPSERSSPAYNPDSSPAYSPNSPAYSPNSPPYEAVNPAYNPPSPSYYPASPGPSPPRSPNDAFDVRAKSGLLVRNNSSGIVGDRAQYERQVLKAMFHQSFRNRRTDNILMIYSGDLAECFRRVRASIMLDIGEPYKGDVAAMDMLMTVVLLNTKPRKGRLQRVNTMLLKRTRDLMKRITKFYQEQVHPHNAVDTYRDLSDAFERKITNDDDRELDEYLEPSRAKRWRKVATRRAVQKIRGYRPKKSSSERHEEWREKVHKDFPDFR